MASKVSSILSTLVKDAKTAVTIGGTVAAALTEITPLVPAADKAWVAGAILVLTILGRDITDIVNNLPTSLSPPAAP